MFFFQEQYVNFSQIQPILRASTDEPIGWSVGAIDVKLTNEACAYDSCHSTGSLCSTHTILILSCSGPQAYKIRIILSFRRLPRATSGLIKTNSCLTQSYPVICEVLPAEVRPQIISTPFNRAVMLIGTRFRRMFLLLGDCGGLPHYLQLIPF